MFRLFKAKSKPVPEETAPLTLLPGSEGEHYLQAKYNTTQRALRFYDKQVLSYLSPVMKEFIAKQETLFIATSDKHGECDCSFRFGKPGFVKVLNDHYLAYPEYRGNGVLASQGNIIENPHIGMIMVDFFNTTVGLHVNGKAKIIENEELLRFRTDLPKDIIAEINQEGQFRPERWIMVEIEEAYIHCSKHIPLLRKADKEISWGTDDDTLKRSDFFRLQDIPLYMRLGGEKAIQAIADAVTLRLTLDNSLRPFLKNISLQSLLNKQKYFLKCAFGGNEPDQAMPENLRNFYRELTSANLDELHLHKAIMHLRETLADLDVPEREIAKLFEQLENNKNTIDHV